MRLMGVNRHLQGGLTSLARCRRQVDAHLTSADSPSEHVEGRGKKPSLLHSLGIYYLINIIFEILLKSGRNKATDNKPLTLAARREGQEQRSTKDIACSMLAILISLAETDRNRCRPCFLIAS